MVSQRDISPKELRIFCRDGTVYLYGNPPGGEHKVLIEILTDVLGLKDVVDRTDIDELLCEKQERSKREKIEKTLPWEAAQGTEDIVEVARERKEFFPADRPILEEE